MSIEGTIDFLREGEMCIVCGRGLKAGEALAAVYEGENRLPICCRLCLAAYQEDPKPFLERFAQRKF